MELWQRMMVDDHKKEGQPGGVAVITWESKYLWLYYFIFASS